MFRFTVAVSILTGSLIGFPVYAEDLLQIYRDAVVNDARYAAARSQLASDSEILAQGRAGLLPTVDLSANTTWNDNETTLGSRPSVHSKFNTNGYGLTLAQPIFRWQNIVVYDQSRLQVAYAQSQFVLAQQELILRVAQAYFAILYAEENLAALLAQKTAIAEQLAQAKKNFEVGTATITDTHEAQSRFDLLVAQVIAAENELEVSRQALQVIIGREPKALARPEPDARLVSPQPEQMEPWVQQAEEGAIPVLLQQMAAEIAAKEIAVQRAGHYPTLDLVANVGRNKGLATSSTSEGTPLGLRNQEDYANIGLQLNIPVYQGGMVSSRTRAASASRDAALSALDQARRDAALLAKQSYLGVVNGLSQIQALQAAQTSSRSALESNKLGYRVGIRINLDVLDAEQQVSVVRRDLAKARYDTLVYHLKLKSAVGSLNEQDLEEINALLVE